jgi:hypothetical protein
VLFADLDHVDRPREARLVGVRLVASGHGRGLVHPECWDQEGGNNPWSSIATTMGSNSNPGTALIRAAGG